MKVDISHEEARELARVLRAKGEHFIARANEIERSLPTTTMTVSVQQPQNGQTVTAAELERSVASRSGRINDLANRLNTTPEHIQSLLESSRVFVAERGWLKVKPKPIQVSQQ